MEDCETLRARIAALSDEIAAGVEQTTVDGTTVRVSLQVKQQERTRLQRKLAKLKRRRGASFVRPVDMGGF